MDPMGCFLHLIFFGDILGISPGNLPCHELPIPFGSGMRMGVPLLGVPGFFPIERLCIHPRNLKEIPKMTILKKRSHLFQTIILGTLPETDMAPQDGLLEY